MEVKEEEKEQQQHRLLAGQKIYAAEKCSSDIERGIEAEEGIHGWNDCWHIWREGMEEQKKGY